MLQCQRNQYITVRLEDFKALLKRIAESFDSQDALARAIGINGSRLSRAINVGDFPFNVENCLRLAKISGESPSEILRAAGKKDIANLLESLYGPDRTKLLTVEERELLDRWDALSPKGREALKTLIADLTPKATKAHKRSA